MKKSKDVLTSFEKPKVKRKGVHSKNNKPAKVYKGQGK